VESGICPIAIIISVALKNTVFVHTFREGAPTLNFGHPFHYQTHNKVVFKNINWQIWQLCYLQLWKQQDSRTGGIT